jgi:hypothetical protein
MIGGRLELVNQCVRLADRSPLAVLAIAISLVDSRIGVHLLTIREPAQASARFQCREQKRTEPSLE